MNGRVKPIAILAAACLCLSACSDSQSSANAAPDANSKVTAAPTPPPVKARVHVHTPRLDELRRALDFGDRAQVASLLDAANDAPAEAALLRARASALEPKGVMEALRLVTIAREADPKNPEVYATAAEIYAANGSFETGWQEIERGLAACGESAELIRARGVLWIARENGARKGLEHLQRAYGLDPDLPFMDRALGQAHLLVAKQEAQARRPAMALEHAKKSLAFDPDDRDARRFLSDAHAEMLEFQEAITVLEGLANEDRALRPELAAMHKKAALGALLEHDRPRALNHFVVARDLGLSEGDLASGAALLDQEARLKTELGLFALDKGDLAKAEAELREAVRYEPRMLAPRNHLGVVLFKRGQFAEAALLWRGVVSEARAEGLELPDPVHVNLALALKSAGELDAARRVLDEYLEAEPNGTWREPTLRARESLETPR
jgi:tetratricopeptide (TPR) repeat protein